MSRYLSPILIVLAILAVLGGSVYLYMRIFRGVPELSEPGLPETTTPPPLAEEMPPPPPPPMDLPPLEESDPFVRTLIGELSSHPELAKWLVNEKLVRRFVTVVDNVARGESPRVHVPFLEPGRGFEVKKANGRSVISERSFRRYDRVAAVVVSLDPSTSVELYREVAPLFEKAYAELGNPDSFDDALIQALDRLLAVEVPEGEIEVSQRLKNNGYADGALESLGPAEKHLLRMGPDNAREIQAKLLTFKTALKLNPSTRHTPTP